MSNLRFFKIGESFYNIDHVKELRCDDENCEMTLKNSKSLNYRTWSKEKNKEQYQDARRNWLILRRIHRQQVFNTPIEILEREDSRKRDLSHP